MDPGLSEFQWPSFADIAKSLGGFGHTVTSMDELETAVAALDDRKGPVLIELKLDPNDVPRMRA